MTPRVLLHAARTCEDCAIQNRGEVISQLQAEEGELGADIRQTVQT